MDTTSTYCCTGRMTGGRLSCRTQTSLNIGSYQITILGILESMHPVNVLAVEILFHLAFHTGIPMILNGIVGTTW